VAVERVASGVARGPHRAIQRNPCEAGFRKIWAYTAADENGKLTNTIVKTYPQVSQFWTYDPKKFIEQPVFSRDFPPSQNLE
jgi:branched-chain amino acid transport system substrate-binding protein